MIDNNQVAGENSQLNIAPSQYQQGVPQYQQGSFQNMPNNPQNIEQNQISNAPNVVPNDVDNKELYSVMKQVVELKQGTQLRDVYNLPQKQDKPKEDLVRPPEETKPLITNVQKEFKNLFNKDMLQNNSYRKRVLYLLIAVILLNCLVWQALCVHLNVCYGEALVMQGWFSQTIFPLIILLIICYVILYFSTDVLYKPGIQIMNILIILLMLFFIAFGIFGIISSVSKTVADMNDSWNQMTQNSKNYYNTQQIFFEQYKESMLITSILYLVIAGTGILLLIFSYQFFYILTVSLFDWRPPLRSRFHDDRAGRIIELYAMFNEEFRRLHEAENRKQNNQIINNNNQESNQMILPLSSLNQNNNINKQEEGNNNSPQKQGLPQPRRQIYPLIRDQVDQGENDNQNQIPKPNQNEMPIQRTINANPATSSLPARKRLPPVKKDQ